MLQATRSLLVALAMLPVVAAARTADPAPEVQRLAGGTPQPVGQVHSVRNIPEACVRIDGQFTGDPATAYRIQVVPHDRCAQRAVYVEAATLQPQPSVARGWILNDRISVTRADRPECVVTIEVWRKPGDTAPPSLDAQGRSRLYLDKPQERVAAPLFTALEHAKGCG